MKKHGVSSAAELRQQAAAYAELCEARDAAQADANAKSAAADTLYGSLSSNEQGILLEVRRFAPGAFDIPTADQLLRSCAVRRKELAEADAAAREARARWEALRQQSPEASGETPETMGPPARSREAVAAELEAARAALAQARSSADQLGGQLRAAGDPAALESAIGDLSEKIDALEGEYQSIRLAMEVLDTANTTLQNRFSPELGRRAAEIFRQLTGGRYTAWRWTGSSASLQSLPGTPCSGMPPFSPLGRWINCTWRYGWPSAIWCCRRRRRCPLCWMTRWPTLTTPAAPPPCGF